MKTFEHFNGTIKINNIDINYDYVETNNNIVKYSNAIVISKYKTAIKRLEGKEREGKGRVPSPQCS